MSAESSMFKIGDVVTSSSSGASRSELDVEELRLPKDFYWGAATAAYQIEGGTDQDGKGKSIWDAFTHLDPSRTNGENGDVACDHYNRVSDDVELMASLGLEVYRFSISWTRLIPLGGRHDSINEKGIAFYSNLIDQLLAHNIEPLVTLYHWDAPQTIYERYGAFLDTTEFIKDFAHFARLCFCRFGDRVKRWITFNEPYIISIFGHHSGVLAPGRCAHVGTDTKTEPWLVGHTIILAHATAVRLYTADFQPTQRGAISIVLNSHFYEPYNVRSRADVDAAQRRLEFYVGWFGDPIFLGKDYPSAMREYLGSRLPEFTPDDLGLLQQTARANAFYGMNHYTTKYARALLGPAASDDWTGNIEETAINSEGREIGPASGVQWLRTAPQGFRKLMNWVWDRYHLPIIITENGCPCPGEDKKEIAVNDRFRQNYYGLYLDAISRAIFQDSIPVEGYCAWSLVDNFGSFAPYHYVLFETIVYFTVVTNTHQSGLLVTGLGLVSCMLITRPRNERPKALPFTSKEQ
ncbi:hypothetical protein PFICI_07363 [Pestalotiopsis fici W106-1]|uniref:Beta-glucosidase 1B n=1 Tax=Pestalotiopsis fici (strain W106-1 / CGMCC3.15140) TaxID=1229662 RepID=W3X1E9_PESFW|nr:uncharacterized protein PFICI_07363 [Pestalotiopsis fici W106-1]ETS79834.1 hypothetical protein PFICI_07363 [Pestalotiopsis fici W106-1]